MTEVKKNKQNFGSQGIAISVILSVLAISIVFLTYNAVNSQKKVLKEELAVKGLVVSNNIASKVLLDVLFEDTEKLEKISISASEEDVDLTELAFYRKSGSLIYSNSDSLFLREIISQPQAVFYNEHSVEIITQINSQQGNPVGFLITRFHTDRIDKISESLIKRLILTNAGAFVVIAIIIFILIFTIRKQDASRISQIIRTESAVKTAEVFKEKNKELEEAKEKADILASFPQENPNPVIRCDKNGAILYLNKGGEFLLEHYSSDLTKIPHQLISFIVKAFEQNEVIFEDISINDKHFNICFSPSVKYEAVNIFALDITERIFTKHQLELANSYKDQFLSTMSHEIRTPLNAVIGMTRYLLNHNPSEHQVEKLKVLKTSANNLLALINDILDYSKIEAGKLDIEYIEFDVVETLDSIKQTFDLKAEEKQIDLLFEIDKNMPRIIIGDSVRLSQIVNNLISNAIKFTDSGYVKLIGKVIHKTNDIAKISFTVKDSGIGIAKDKQSTIFDNFSQESTATTRKYGGTGLGLAITKKLVELHGGKLSLDSEPGKGSAFSFELEYQIGEISFEHLHETNEQQNLDLLKGLNVLVVDDNEFNLLIAEQTLADWNVNITTALSGREAIEKATNQKFDFILMDIHMPEMDGYETAKYMREHPNECYNDSVIIALTADAFADVRKKVLEFGMADHVSKPIDVNELYTKMVKYLA